MVILIGGASHTGKTCLAQRILEKYQEYAIRLSEQTEATSYLNRLKKRLASIKR